MEKFTLVSSLFNINREKMDGRSWDEYLKWFDITLKLKCPMVLFVSEDLVPFINARRINIPTHVITHSVQEIPYYYLKDNLDVIINSDEYKNKILDPDRIECQQSIYSIIQYSKFKWLEKAIEKNPFNSKFFFWIDAGASRFFEDYDLTLEYPSTNAIKALDEMGNKFLIQMNMEFYEDLAKSDFLDSKYLLDNRSYVLGSIFGGTSNKVLKVGKDVENVLLYEMLQNQFVNNEQIALGYLVKVNPNDYEIYERYDYKHMSLFNELGKR